MVDRFTITAAEQDPWIDADPSGQWVRYSDYAALEAQLAERAGGVKALRWPPKCPRGQRVYGRGTVFENSNYCIAHYGGDTGSVGIYRWAAPAGAWSDPFETYEAAKAAAQADYERRILSALEPAAPEGRQEAVACIACEDKPAVPNDPCAVCGKSARPTERAVTEAMVEAAIAAMFHGHGWFPPPYAMRAALKAAMEAGG